MKNAVEKSSSVFIDAWLGLGLMTQKISLS